MAVATVAELTEHTADYLEIVELGGRVFIRDGGEPVGELVPTSKAQHLLREVMAELPPGDVEAAQALFLGEGSIDRDALEVLLSKLKETRERIRTATVESQDWIAARIAQLEAEGLIRPPLEPLPADFFTRPKPRFPGGSVLEELLAERRESRW